MTTSLPTTRLGWTGMHLTRTGFGAWAIGGGDWAYAWGRQDDAASIAAIRQAVESGINWIDTAAVYGLGHSEEVMAAALAGLPEADRPYVFTKGGLVWDRAGRGWHAAGGVLAGLHRSQARGQDPRGRPVQPRHRAAEIGRAHV